jgi:hypothetical protein
MFRVITERHGQVHNLRLLGTLGGEWVALLEQQWRSIADAVPFARVVVVLSEVEFIDSDGERLLDRMADGGVEFVVSGCMNRYVVDKLQRARRARRRKAEADVPRVRQEPRPSARHEGSAGAEEPAPGAAAPQPHRRAGYGPRRRGGAA